MKLQEKTKLIAGVLDPKGEKKLEPGMHDLLEEEKILQKQLKKEIDDIEPLWVRKLVDSQVLFARKLALELRISELKAKMAEKKP
jgi:hypothetical protein